MKISVGKQSGISLPEREPDCGGYSISDRMIPANSVRRGGGRVDMHALRRKYGSDFHEHLSELIPHKHGPCKRTMGGSQQRTFRRNRRLARTWPGKTAGAEDKTGADMIHILADHNI